MRENSKKDVPVLAGSKLELVPIWDRDLPRSPKLAEILQREFRRVA